MIDTEILELDDELKYEEAEIQVNDIPKVHAASISYSKFFFKFLAKNQPVILTGVVDNWKCTKLWIKNKSLTLDYFREKYNEARVPVSNCGKRWFNIQEKCSMTMKEYLAYWETYSNNPSDDSPCLYLKDWHFMKEFPNENVYRVPCFFASDWLNEFYDNNNTLDDDFRFVYIGPKGSWTPFHLDVLTSFSWSANICGRKKWILLPPGVEQQFRDEFGHFKYDIDEETVSDRPDICNIIQDVGEIVFVPSGWYHQVWNVENAISINHNWINGCNVLSVWESLKHNLTEVKKEISDCIESPSWKQDCQRLLKASFGFDYYLFYFFLKMIAESRMEKLSQGKSLPVYGDWFMGKKHMIFDLKQILSLLNIIIVDADFRELDFTQKREDPIKFSENLKNFLTNIC